MNPHNSVINEKLLAEIIRLAPHGDLYVFGYGSLMWRPGFSCTESDNGRVYGYSRRCAVLSKYYRGTPTCPGLVLGLDVGGSCRGMVYRVAAEKKNKVIRYLFKREMFADVYYPHYVTVHTAHGLHGRCRALTFIVRRSGSQYSAPMSDVRAAAMISAAAGVGGSNSEYFHNTRHYLRQSGIVSPMIENICCLLDKK